MNANYSSKKAPRARVHAGPDRKKGLITLSSGLFLLALFFFMTPSQAHACDFWVEGSDGAPVKGPSFDMIDSGLTQGLLECGPEIHHLMVMTISVDESQSHIGVRDNPLFHTNVTGPLRSIEEFGISSTSKLHVLRKVREETLIGNRRGYVRFATVCENAATISPLDCSWGASRIKVRSTILDTNRDGKVDRSYHELSVYNGSDKLHMVTFWTPHREHLASTTTDWVKALQAFGLDVSKNAG